MPDVKIKGYSGAELEYKDVPKVYLAAPESTVDNPVLVPFSYGEAVDGVEITPDFAGGDMTVTMPDGYLARSAVVKQPAELVPENIAKGIVVAGIEGTHEGKEGGGTGPLSEEILKWFAYQIDTTNNQIILWRLMYNVLYEKTGSYDVHIPDKIGDYDVVISCL